jgi:hypothetical protein
MADDVKILDSDFDTFKFERAFVASHWGELIAVAVVSGVECNISTKPLLLHLGMAVCDPIDQSLVENWPVYVDVEINGLARREFGLTTNPGVLMAAKKFAELDENGKIVNGMTL